MLGPQFCILIMRTVGVIMS